MESVFFYLFEAFAARSPEALRVTYEDASRVEQLSQNAAAVEVTLSEDVLRRLDSIFASGGD